MECCSPLLEKARHGDVEAFEAIFDEYHLRICRYLCSLVDDLDLAEDLAQQTFVKAYRSLARGSRPDNLKAWLYTIATNTATSALRRRRLIRWLPLSANAAVAKGPGQEARLGERDLLQQTLDRLPSKDAACLLLRFQHGLSYGELAEILGTSIPAARMRLSRARAAFREIYLTTRPGGEPMNCRQTCELLPLYVDGDLQEPDLEAVSGHLEGCKECRARVAVDRELTAALAGMSAPTGATAIAPAVRRGVMARIEKERLWGPLRRRAESLGNATAWVAVSAVTALLLLALAVTWRPMLERAGLATTPGTSPERITLYNRGQADEVSAGLSAYAPVAGYVRDVLQGVEGNIQAALANPWEYADRVKREGLALEVIYPEPGIQVGAFESVTAVLIPLDEGRSIYLGRERYDRLVPTKAEQALGQLRLVFGVGPVPTAESPARPTVAPEAPVLGEPVDLVELPPSVGGSYWLSPDGRWVAYVAPRPPGDDEPNPRTLLARNLETGESETLLDSLPAEARLSWFPDSRHLAIAVGPGGGQDRALVFEGLGDRPGRTLAVPEGDGQGFGEVAVSPDGGRVAFTVYHDAGPAPLPRVGIEVIDLETSGRRQVVEPDYFIGHLAWTPDGSQIVYFKGKGGTPPDDGESYVANVDGSGEPQLVIARARLAAWSPDTRQALWLGEPADERGKGDLVLGSWPAAGPPSVLVKGADAFRAAWTRDCCVVYAQEGALYLLATGSDAPPQPRQLTAEGEWATAPEWLPGKGLAYLATREGSAAPVLRLLPLAGQQVPVVETVAGLVVEEYTVADEQTGFPKDVEGTGWLGPEILDRRRPWREPDPAAQVAASNEALHPFGYRLELEEMPGRDGYLYALYRGDEVLFGDVLQAWPVAVSSAGDDFALLVEPARGRLMLVRRGSVQEWDPGLHAYQAPVFVGQDLVSVENDAEHRQYAVRKGEEIVYTFTPQADVVSEPVEGLWSWQGHWVLEVNGQVVVDGRDLNQELGYDEIFGWRLLQGRPFYFFRRGESVGISYDGQVLPQQYEQVPHYQCCSGAAYNPGGSDAMAWFFGLRGGAWHYVEMGIYGPTAPEELAVSETTAPTATATPPPPLPTVAPAEVEVTVYFVDRDRFNAGMPPFEVAVSRLVPATANLPEAVLQAYFEGPTDDERAQGLEAVTSGFAGYSALEVQDGIAHVHLTGPCVTHGAAYNVAAVLIKNLLQFEGIRYVKLYDAEGTTQDPEGETNSIPACLEP